MYGVVPKLVCIFLRQFRVTVKDSVFPLVGAVDATGDDHIEGMDEHAVDFFQLGGHARCHFHVVDDLVQCQRLKRGFVDAFRPFRIKWNGVDRFHRVRRRGESVKEPFPRERVLGCLCRRIGLRVYVPVRIKGNHPLVFIVDEDERLGIYLDLASARRLTADGSVDIWNRVGVVKDGDFVNIALVDGEADFIVFVEISPWRIWLG